MDLTFELTDPASGAESDSTESVFRGPEVMSLGPAAAPGGRRAAGGSPGRSSAFFVVVVAVNGAMVWFALCELDRARRPTSL